MLMGEVRGGGGEEGRGGGGRGRGGGRGEKGGACLSVLSNRPEGLWDNTPHITLDTGLHGVSNIRSNKIVRPITRSLFPSLGAQEESL